MKRVLLSLGSNLFTSLQKIHGVINTLNNLPNTHLVSCSSYYRSRPLGPQNQPNFLNVVVALNTSLKPQELLNYIQKIEFNNGRIRNKINRWGPRTLDIDILLFGNDTIKSSSLTIPHYDMYNREFILYPLFELMPNLIFPDGSLLVNRLSQVSRNHLTYWNK